MELLGKQQCFLSQCCGGDGGTQRQPGQGFGCRVQASCVQGCSSASEDPMMPTVWPAGHGGPVVGSEVGHPMLLVSALRRLSMCSFPLHLCMSLWDVACVPTWTCTWLGQRPFSPVHLPSQPWALILCLQEGLMRQRTGKKLLCPFSGEGWNASPDWCAISWVGWLPSPSMVLPRREVHPGPLLTACGSPVSCAALSPLRATFPALHLCRPAVPCTCCSICLEGPPPPPPRKFLLTSSSGRLFQLR